MSIQRFRHPIFCWSLILRVNSFGSIFLRHKHSVKDYSIVIKSLKIEFDIRHLKIEDLPRLKISVRNPIFRNDVVVDSSDIPEEDIDREVRRVYVNRKVLPPADNIPATPQLFLNSAVYNLSKQSGAIASESLWLCGSLAIKNFCISNGFDPKLHTSKNRVVRFLEGSFKGFRSQLDSSWNALNACYQNAYEDDLPLDKVHDYLESAELFCNTLFDIHQTKQFKREEFRKYLQKSMKKEGNFYFDFY